ncbi:MAG: hypothetical protein HOV87_12085 [Catenulispora sp.]|nr:hypothetical protein [Catenulispora sp.]NUT40011.1 hypothetical protein [Thermoactinospora sp.]
MTEAGRPAAAALPRRTRVRTPARPSFFVVGTDRRFGGLLFLQRVTSVQPDAQPVPGDVADQLLRRAIAGLAQL